MIGLILPSSLPRLLPRCLVFPRDLLPPTILKVECKAVSTWINGFRSLTVL